MIYTVDDFSSNDKLLAEERSPVPIVRVQTRTVTIVDEMPPVIALRNRVGYNADGGGGFASSGVELELGLDNGTSIIIIDGAHHML